MKLVTDFKKLEEIKAKAYGNSGEDTSPGKTTSKDKDSKETSQSVLDRIKSKIDGTYDGGIDLDTVKSWFTESENTIKGYGDYYKANEGKWVSNYGSDYTDSIAKLRSNAEAVGYYLRSHKNEFDDYDSLPSRRSQGSRPCAVRC